jgi:hypothetical protein
MFDTGFLANWQAELKEMNKGKERATYRCPNSLILLLATALHVYFLPYRQLEGFLKVMSAHIQELGEVQDYTTMWWRVVRVKVQEELNSELNPEKVEDLITIAVDSTVKVTNRGEWIRDKWKKRRGFIKIHVAVNIKTKKIVSMEVTKEDVVDGKMLKPLTRQEVLLITSSSSSCTTINRVVGWIIL